MKLKLGDSRDSRIALNCICCSSASLKRFPAVLMPFVAKRVFDHDPVEITEEWNLRDIKLGMAYTLCNTVECADCGVLFLDYRFSDFELSRLYSNYRDDDYNKLRMRYEPSYVDVVGDYDVRHSYIQVVEQYLSGYVSGKPSILDWGGGSGINTPLRFQARCLHIYDISNVDVCAEARRVTYEECRNNLYDLVVCSEVLEHVPYPLLMLSSLRKMLNPDTILYIEVPLESIFQERCDHGLRGCKKRHWHEHINFFSPESLNAMVLSCELKVLSSKIIPITLGTREAKIQAIICKLAAH